MVRRRQLDVERKEEERERGGVPQVLVGCYSAPVSHQDQ